MAFLPIDKMQGANSQVTYFNDHIEKNVTDDEQYEQPLEVAALREAYHQALARTVYPFVPKVYSVVGTVINMERVDGKVLEEYLPILAASEDIAFMNARLDFLTRKVELISRALSSIKMDHRDINYQNLIIDEDDNLWIVDFGRAEIGGDPIQIIEDNMFMFTDTLYDFLESKSFNDMKHQSEV